MRILFAIHLYLPNHAAGGEVYCHNMAKALNERGHEARVLLIEHAHYGITRQYNYEGVEVFPATRDVTAFFSWADAVICHLGHTVWASHIAKAHGKPIFFISHNTHPYDIVIFSNEWKRNNQRCQPINVIYNSESMKEILKYENPSVVLHPVIDRKRFDFGGPKGEFITLVNMNANKGGKLFRRIAEMMPERKFLGIGGSYDTQYAHKAHNITVWPNSPDMAPVYKASRIVLMPSAFESWGMVATEAMCNGIPVIYNSTYGLRENVGNAGIELKDLNPDYEEKDLKGGEHPGIDPEANVEQWCAAIRSLDNKNTYRKFSTLARQRVAKMNPEAELNALENFLINEVRNY